jgi:hypothetical protein
MFWFIRSTLKTIITIKLMALAFAAGVGTAYALQQRLLYRTWGLVPGGVARGMSGDVIVAEPDIVETRAIEIEAAPEDVWPWLVQMGHGRGGWYSHPVFDRAWSPTGGASSPSADTILEEFQDLAEGDLVPIAAESGFEVSVLETGRALVLKLDDRMMREQMEEFAADGSEDAAEAVAEMEMPPYTVSWAFELEPAPGGRTLLIERVRVKVAGLSESQQKAVPMLGYGLFVLMRGQLEGIKQRVEAASVAAA